MLTLVSRAGLPTSVAGLPPSAEVSRRMLDDKKTLGGRLRVIVPRGLGSAGVLGGVEAGVIECAIDAIRRP